MAPNNTLPIWGNEKTMNLNTLILTNIQSSPYFKVNLYELKTYHEAIDEIYYKVSHLEPWEKGSRKTAGQTGMCGGVRGVGAGGIVSSAYCLLYKLFTLRLTRKQLQGLLDHADSPYIRGLGFMYIRYTQDPKYFWEWYEPYLDDDEEIDVKAGGGHTITIGEMLRQWLVKLEWYSTLFPRIPVPVQKDIDVKMRARLAEKFRQFEGDPSQQPAMEEQGGQQQQPRHIADDEVNFGEAEKYATNAAIRKRSPTPPYRSRPRTPPPRRRTPPPRHRSPPRHRGDSHRRPRSRSRSPRRGGSASDDYSRELQRERERQNKDRGRRSRSRERKSHYDRDSDSRKRSSYKDDDDDDPINFAKNMLRQKEQREKEDREQQEKRSQDGESDNDDDPINFAKKLLKQKEEQQRKIRERELALQKKAEGVTEENNKSSSKHSKSSSDRHKHKKSSKEHKRKRSRSRDRNSKKSREKGSSKHRSRSRERKKHRAEHDHKEKRDLET